MPVSAGSRAAVSLAALLWLRYQNANSRGAVALSELWPVCPGAAPRAQSLGGGRVPPGCGFASCELADLSPFKKLFTSSPVYK